MTGPAPDRNSLRRSVETHRQRRERSRQERERPFAGNLALFGTLGWLIVVPAVAGAFLGRWLDRILGTGITLTAALILIGIVAGGVMAWKRIEHE